MTLSEDQLDALARRVIAKSDQYHCDWSEGTKALQAPDGSFIRSFTPNGLITSSEEEDYQPRTLHERESSYEPMFIGMPAVSSSAPVPNNWKPVPGDPEYVDWILGIRKRPYDRIANMISTEHTLPITRGMTYDLGSRRLRSEDHRPPYHFALDFRGRIAVTALGGDRESRSEPNPMCKSSELSP